MLNSVAALKVPVAEAAVEGDTTRPAAVEEAVADRDTAGGKEVEEEEAVDFLDHHRNAVKKKMMIHIHHDDN